MGKGLSHTLERAAGQDPVGLGNANGAGVELVRSRFLGGNLVQAVLSVTDLTLALTDVAGVVAYCSQKIFDFPEGHILLLGAVADLALTKDAAGVADTWNGDVALGTVAAAGDATLTGTEADIVPSTATPAAVAGVSSADCQSTGTESGSILDGHATAKDCYLNLLVDDADQDVTTTPTNLIVNGTIKLTYILLGDN